MIRWYMAKFLELSGMSLLGSALYFGMVQDNMTMEVKLLMLGVIVFLSGLILEKRGAE